MRKNVSVNQKLCPSFVDQYRSFCFFLQIIIIDDFDQIIRVHIAQLVTLSVRIVARCGLLYSNANVLRYDFDILIADFGRDSARVQASPASIRVRLVCSRKT